MARRGQYKYSLEVRNQCVALYVSEMQPREISKKIDVPSSCIEDWCRKASVLRTPEQARFLQKKQGVNQGSDHYAWNGGNYIDEHGYVQIYQGPLVKEKSEHVLIVERLLERKLKRSECIHHINGIKSDNRNHNLLVCSRKYHTCLHHRMSQLYMKEHFNKQQKM
jgi:hypothetical protein